jgi:hypothetical protein
MAAERTTAELKHNMTANTGGCRRLSRIRKPRTELFAIVAGIGLPTAACSSGSSTPQVASLRTSGSGNSAGNGNGSGSSAAPGSAGNATRLVDEWAACMRSHGDLAQELKYARCRRGRVPAGNGGSGANG